MGNVATLRGVKYFILFLTILRYLCSRLISENLVENGSELAEILRCYYIGEWDDPQGVSYFLSFSTLSSL